MKYKARRKEMALWDESVRRGVNSGFVEAVVQAAVTRVAQSAKEEGMAEYLDKIQAS